MAFGEQSKAMGARRAVKGDGRLAQSPEWRPSGFLNGIALSRVPDRVSLLRGQYPDIRALRPNTQHLPLKPRVSVAQPRF